jgi:hypothetical protein
MVLRVYNTLQGVEKYQLPAGIVNHGDTSGCWGLISSSDCAILPGGGTTMTYPGGKGSPGVVQKIINQIPPHRVYIEPFLGSGRVILAKKRAQVSIGVEVDQSVIDRFWRPAANRTWAEDDHVVLCGDAISYLRDLKYDPGDKVFIYCDPPYLFDTRANASPIYNYEFGEVGQHKELLTVLKSLPYMVAISAYPSSLYSEMLQEWRSITYKSRTRGGKSVPEVLWMNYPEPAKLHDYRFLGDNFRERERIGRIRKRWIARLARLPALERYALLGMFADLTSSDPA